jgi:hypothetical protein
MIKARWHEGDPDRLADSRNRPGHLKLVRRGPGRGWTWTISPAGRRSISCSGRSGSGSVARRRGGPWRGSSCALPIRTRRPWVNGEGFSLPSQVVTGGRRSSSPSGWWWQGWGAAWWKKAGWVSIRWWNSASGFGPARSSSWGTTPDPPFPRSGFGGARTLGWSVRKKREARAAAAWSAGGSRIL